MQEMTDLKAKEIGSRTVSMSTPGGALVELLFDPLLGSTRFAVYARGEIALVDDYRTESGELLLPLLGSHGLIRHRVVLLPSFPLEYGSKEELIYEIEEYISRFVSLSPTFISLAAHYVLLTWVYDAFGEVPYLRFQGDFGSGKTRALKVIGSICYKPIFASGASTVSPIFHSLDLFRGTLIFDEADFRASDERAEVTKIFNSGTTRGFPVLRSSQNAKKDFDPRAFNVFGPKIVGMRDTFEDYALESRFLTETMSHRPEPHVPINLPASQEDEALRIRNQLLLYRLRERGKASLDDVSIDPTLSSRGSQVLAPLLAVTSGESARRAFVDLLIAQEEEHALDRSTEGEALVLDTILHLAAKQPEATHLPLALIRDEVLWRHGGEFERPMTSRRLGGLVRNRLRLKSYKNGVYLVEVPTGALLTSLRARYGIPPQP